MIIILRADLDFKPLAHGCGGCADHNSCPVPLCTFRCNYVSERSYVEKEEEEATYTGGTFDPALVSLPLPGLASIIVPASVISIPISTTGAHKGRKQAGSDGRADNRQRIFSRLTSLFQGSLALIVRSTMPNEKSTPV